MVPEINSGKLREVDILIEFKAHGYSVGIAIEVVRRLLLNRRPQSHRHAGATRLRLELGCLG